MFISSEVLNDSPSVSDPMLAPSPEAWIDGSVFAIDRCGPGSRAFQDFDAALLTTPIIELFAAAVRAHPTNAAVDDGVSRLSYQATWNAVQHLARRIAAETLPGSLVGILLPAGTSFPVAMLACLAAGRPFLPMDSHYPQRWIEQVVEDAGMKAVIGRLEDPASASLLPPSVRRIDIAPSLAIVDGAGTYAAGVDAARLTPLGPDEPAMVLYTSGSAGRPKGIVNSQRNLLRRVEQYVNAAHISEHDRFLPLSSDCTIAGVRERLTALLTGATLHLIDAQRASVRQIAATLRRERITMIYAVPALLRSIVQLADGAAPDSLRVVRVGGDAVLGSDVEMLRSWLPESCLIELGYSSTEAPIMQWFIPPDFETNQGKLPIGYPLAGNQLAILDDDKAPVAAGEVGELVVRSPYVALGRLIDGQCLGQDFPADPTDPLSRILHTGDLVRLRPDGLIDLIGRKDRQIKIRGQRVEPGEVEAAILRWRDVRDAAVIGRQDAGQTTLVAYVTAQEDAPATLVQDLTALLKQTLPPPLRPRGIYRLEQIPRLPSAKLDLQSLRALDQEIHRGEEVARSSSEVFDPMAGGGEVRSYGSLEDTVEAIWRNVLKRSDIGRDADFFDFGGDSLSVIHMMFEIERALGVELPITMIYQTPTIASLSMAIRARSEASFSPLVLVKEGGDAPPFFIVHGIGGNVMELFALGRSIDHPGPVFAVQSRGLDGRETPNQSVPEMAEDYRAAIQALQPNGPYFIAGYSFGGAVAFELAHLLTARGGEVGLLALLDTATNSRQWPVHVWARWIAGRAWEHTRAFGGIPAREWGGYVRRIARGMRAGLLWRFGVGAAEESSFAVAGIPAPLAAVRNANIAASAAYVPRFYDGVLTLVTSTLGAPSMCDPRAIWKNRAAVVENHRTPGDHVTMIDGRNGQDLARLLSECLRAVPRMNVTSPVRLRSNLALGEGEFAEQAPA